MTDYDHKKIEEKWQRIWEKENYYHAEDNSKKPKFYALIEFPYPSGDGLHVGHPRPYIGMDTIARKRRLQGFNVLYPIGWDAFGLPTENFAIKTGQDPRVVTKTNSENFKRQIKAIGISFDWKREINTTDPKYYKWTQWIFLQFFKHGLAYKAKALINWCPKDKIGLANEEVIDGKCERCGTQTEKREKVQWMMAITKYADRLDKDLDTVDYLPQIKTQQRNWIGKSEGAEIEFETTNGKSKIKVFTIRPDTIFGATYLVVAPEHPLIEEAESEIVNYGEVATYTDHAKKKTDIERTAENKTKTGIELKGIKAINPANKKAIPIFIADYVLYHYGTGAIMAVPAHDERDGQFAKKYNLPVKEVVAPHFVDGSGEFKMRPDKGIVERQAIIAVVKHWSDNKYLCLKWKIHSWKGFLTGGIESGESLEETVRREVKEESGYTDIKSIKPLGGIVSSLFWAPHKDANMQRMGQPVLVELGSDAQVEISQEEKDLHDLVWIEEKEIVDFLSHDPNVFDGRYSELIWKRVRGKEEIWTYEGLLINSDQFDGMTSDKAKTAITEFVGGRMVTTYKLRDWVFSRQRYWGEPIPIIHCPKCALQNPSGQGMIPVSEEDLPVILPEVKNYKPTDTGESPLAGISEWVNVKCPKCGGGAKRETDTMPNWAGSSWYFLRYLDPDNNEIFASKDKLQHWMAVDWYNGGMEHTTLHLLYSRFWNKFLFDIGEVPTSEPYRKRTAHGFILAPDGEKMSKSRGNVINPDEVVETFGADTLRLYEMFMGPFDQAVMWSTDGILGPRRFIEKIWRFQNKISDDNDEKETLSLLHRTIKKVTDDIEAMRFNTAVSALMILANSFDKKPKINKESFKLFLLLLSPFCPHVTEEIWHNISPDNFIQSEMWPMYDSDLIKEQKAKIVIQINGKTRGTLSVDRGTKEEEAIKQAESSPDIRKRLENQRIKRVVFVEDKLINFVI